MSRDANEIAREYVRRSRFEPSVQENNLVWGDLTVWDSYPESISGTGARYTKVHLDLKHPGMIIAYYRDRTAMIISLKPGAVALFEPYEGE